MRRALVWLTAVWASESWRRAARMGWSAASSAALWLVLFQDEDKLVVVQLCEDIGSGLVTFAGYFEALGFAGCDFHSESVDGRRGFGRGGG